MNLSKSQYIRGLQCHKSLWLYKNNPELRETPNQAQETLLSRHMILFKDFRIYYFIRKI